MISRFIEKRILEVLKPGRVVGLFGARRTGKTFLMHKIKDELAGKVLMVHGESSPVAEILSSQNAKTLGDFVKGYEYLFIDEAQKIPNIGINLKLLVDTQPDLSVFVSGSSAFELRNRIGEPLVGRSRYLYLHPIAQLELSSKEDYLSARQNLDERLIFGSYPQVLTAETIDDKKEELQSIRDGYLLKDILEMDNLKDSLFVFNLLRLIAFQIGNDISYNELATSLGVHGKTVARYLELLEKSYIIFSLPGFSKNLRKEYTKTPRYYFWDNGVRNAIIANFNPLNSRDDAGKLWENFCMSERRKFTEYTNMFVNRYFWRTYDQKEIDYLEEREGKLYAFEIKWGKDDVKAPKLFLETYPNSEFFVINKDNFLDFLT